MTMQATPYSVQRSKSTHERSPEGFSYEAPKASDPLLAARQTFLRDRGWAPTYYERGERKAMVVPNAQEAERLFRDVLPGAAPLFSKQAGRYLKEIIKVESPIQRDAVERLLTTYLMRAEQEQKPMHHLTRAIECAELFRQLSQNDAWSRRCLFSMHSARFGAQFNVPTTNWPKKVPSSARCSDNQDYLKCFDLTCEDLERGEVFPGQMRFLHTMMQINQTQIDLRDRYTRVAQLIRAYLAVPRDPVAHDQACALLAEVERRLQEA